MPAKNAMEKTVAAVPAEYSGKWVAWNSDHSKIVASGDTLQELWQVVRDQKISDPVFEKVPRWDVRFVGKR